MIAYKVTKIIPILLLAVLISVSCSRKNEPQPIDYPDIQPIHSVKIAISGDAMHHLPQINAARASDGSLNYNDVFAEISKVWRHADFAVVNLETTISPTPPYYGYPCFRSPIEFLDALKQAGVTSLALANNHCVDMSADGVRATIKAIRERGFGFVGLSDNPKRNNILWLSKNNIRIALLNYTYGTNGMPIPAKMQANIIDTILIKKDYTQARQQGATFVIPFFHWGYEYQTKEHNDQKELAMWCRNIGCDYVVGSHPHVVQPADVENRIIYSLGNLVSAQHMPFTQGGITVILEFFSNGYICTKFTPHWVDISDRYRIVMPWDSTIKERAKQFNKSLDDTRKIVTVK